MPFKSQFANPDIFMTNSVILLLYLLDAPLKVNGFLEIFSSLQGLLCWLLELLGMPLLVWKTVMECHLCEHMPNAFSLNHAHLTSTFSDCFNLYVWRRLDTTFLTKKRTALNRVSYAWFILCMIEVHCHTKVVSF